MEKISEIKQKISDFETSLIQHLGVKEKVSILVGEFGKINSREWFLGNEKLAYYNYSIEDGYLKITNIETLNSTLGYDDFRECTTKIKKIPGFGKNLILDILLLSKSYNLDQIEFSHILEESVGFYEKVCDYLIKNEFIKSFFYTKSPGGYTDLILKI